MDDKHNKKDFYITNTAIFRGARVYKLAAETLRENNQNWAAMINACLAVEIYLKCLQFKIVVEQDPKEVITYNNFELKPFEDRFASGHELLVLFEKIPDNVKSVFKTELERHYTEAEYLSILNDFDTVFLDERYMYEPEERRNYGRGKVQKSSSESQKIKSALSTEIVGFATTLDGVVLKVLQDDCFKHAETIIGKY